MLFQQLPVRLLLYSLLLLEPGGSATRTAPSPGKSSSAQDIAGPCCLLSCPDVEGYTFQPGVLPDEGFTILPNDDSGQSDSQLEMRSPNNDDPCGTALSAEATFTVSQAESVAALAAACSAKPLCVAFTTSCKLYAADVQGRAWSQVPKCFSTTCTTSAASCVGTYITLLDASGDDSFGSIFKKLVTKQVENIRSIGLCTYREDPITGKKKKVCQDPVKMSVTTSMLGKQYATAITRKPKVTWPIQQSSIGCGALC